MTGPAFTSILRYILETPNINGITFRQKSKQNKNRGAPDTRPHPTIAALSRSIPELRNRPSPGDCRRSDRRGTVGIQEPSWQAGDFLTTRVARLGLAACSNPACSQSQALHAAGVFNNRSKFTQMKSYVGENCCKKS
ncbi:hypothetical protein ACW73L_13565 [Methylolobus aquaticus]